MTILAHISAATALDNAVVLAIATLIGGLLIAGVTWIVRKLALIARNSSAISEVVMGKPATPTSDKIPSILERFDAQDAEIAAVKHEVENNDGSSVKDSAHRIEASLENLSVTVKAHIEESDAEAKVLSDALEAHVKLTAEANKIAKANGARLARVEKKVGLDATKDATKV